MPAVFDVAAYILHKLDRPITTVKLQKLVYYCQAWSLVWDEEPLFNEPIQAWANGPVVPVLFAAQKGKFKVSRQDFPQGDHTVFHGEQIETMDSVIETYGHKTAQWLIDLTHMEDPWKEARKYCGPGESCQSEITIDSMMNYYSGLAGMV